MATVKELIDEFIDRTNGVREASYVGSSTPAARQYVSLFKQVADELLDNPNGWMQLKRIYSFTTVLNQANYQLPGDYHRQLIGTQWDTTNQIPLAGPLSNARLAFQTYGVNIATPFAGWQVNGAQGYIYNTSPYTQRSAGYFQISPPGQNNTTDMAIAYMSSNYVWPTNWVASTAYVQGNKVAGVNNIYICTVGGTSGTTRPSVTSGTVVDGTVTWQVYTEPYPVTADTDIFLLDDALMVEGLRWAWYESKQQFDAAAIAKRAWYGTVRSALGRQNGAVAINAGIDVTSQWDFPMTPQGSWAGTGDV
jgi:hypothetical protein